MKTICAALAAGALALALVACGGNDDNESTQSSSPSATTASKLALDATFGTAGIAAVPLSATTHDRFMAVATAPDGNIVCFRYAPRGMDGDVLNSVNQEVLLRLQETGVAVPSSTVLRGRYALRVAIVNHRSRQEDFDALAAAVVRLGAEILRERR